MNGKIAVSAEMLALWVSTLLIYSAKHPDKSFGDILTGMGVKSALAVTILWALLLLPIDIDPSATWPPALGFVIIASTMAYEGGQVAGAFTKVLHAQQSPTA